MAFLNATATASPMAYASPQRVRSLPAATRFGNGFDDMSGFRESLCCPEYAATDKAFANLVEAILKKLTSANLQELKENNTQYKNNQRYLETITTIGKTEENAVYLGYRQTHWPDVPIHLTGNQRMDPRSISNALKALRHANEPPIDFSPTHRYKRPSNDGTEDTGLTLWQASNVIRLCFDNPSGRLTSLKRRSYYLGGSFLATCLGQYNDSGIWKTTYRGTWLSEGKDSVQAEERKFNIVQRFLNGRLTTTKFFTSARSLPSIVELPDLGRHDYYLDRESGLLDSHFQDLYVGGFDWVTFAQERTRQPLPSRESV